MINTVVRDSQKELQEKVESPKDIQVERSGRRKNKKSKIALRAKITAHISHLAVEGKGKGKVSCHLARDTQTNLIHK